MRIFAVETGGRTGHAQASALAYRLLGYAVREFWGIECPKIGKNEKGKPYFVGETGKFFSVSHTKSHVLVAVSPYDVGADAETVRDMPEKIVRRIFSGDMLRQFGVFEGWTLRESVYKLTGKGELRKMEFRLADGEIIAPFEGVRCRLYDDLPCCAAAAACYEGDFPEKIEIVPQEIFNP